MENLAKLQIPVIVYVNMRDIEHFSVFKEIDEHFAYPADPSFGNIKVSLKKFQEMFLLAQGPTISRKDYCFYPTRR